MTKKELHDGLFRGHCGGNEGLKNSSKCGAPDRSSAEQQAEIRNLLSPL